MRLCFFILDDSLIGGIERVAITLATEFAKEGHQVTLLSLTRSRDGNGFQISSFIRQKTIGSKQNYRVKSPFRKIAFYWAYFHSLRELNKEFKQTDYIISMFTSLSILNCLFPAIARKTIAMEHGQYFAHNLGIRCLRRLLYSRAHKISVISLTEETRYKQIFKNVEYLPNWLMFDCQGLSPNYLKKTIISVGRLVDEKRFDLMIRLFQLLLIKQPEWKLIIVGDGICKNALSQQIETHHLSDSVSLLGNSMSIPEELAEASIFLCTSSTESFGMAILEAMHFGLPVVSFDCPTGPRDLIRDGVHGYLVPMDEEKLFLDRTEQMMADPKLRETMGNAAKSKSIEFLPVNQKHRWYDKVFKKDLPKV